MSFQKDVRFVFAVLFVLSLPFAPVLSRADSPAPSPAAIDADLLATLADSRADFFVELAARAELDQAYEIRDWDARGWYVYNTLKAVATRAQAPVIRYARAQGLAYHAFFSSNTIYIRGGALDQAIAIAGLPGVVRLYAGAIIPLDPFRVQPAGRRQGTNAYGWNLGPLDPAGSLYGMQAAQVWDDYGVKGAGIVVANIDTGVDYLHPALNRQYRGSLGDGTYDHNYNWYQPTVAGCGDGTYPCDAQGQGSGTMGLMVGETADLTEQIGVAPGARWIACMGCTGSACTTFDLMACMEWMLAPTDLSGSSPDPAMRPHIVNNAWGGAGCDETFALQLQAWRAAGIFPTFSTGANPACAAIGSPGDNPGVLNSAAHGSDGLNLYAGGPSCFFPNPSCEPGAHQVDPHLNSPTFGRTASPSGGYWNLGGSAGAIPHAAGTVALVWSANPAYIGQIDDTFEILEQSANKDVPAGDCGEPACAVNHVPNYEYGWGYLDAYAAVTMAGAPGWLEGTIADARTGALLPGVTVTAALPGDGEWFAVSDPSGYYTMSLGAGTYTVTTHVDGYLDQIAPVAITGNAITTHDFDLEPNAPWIDVDPDSFAQALELGQAATGAFAIHNLGPVALTWNIGESPVPSGIRGPHVVPGFQGDVPGAAARADAIPWLAVHPISGTVPAYGSFTGGEIDYDGGAVAEPGTYVADLYVNSNDPLQPALTLPVTLTVLAAGLDGSVTGTGYCAAERYPLDALLVVEGSNGVTFTAATDPASGGYHLWLGSGSYTVTASATGHLPATQPVQLQAGVSTTLDLALRLVESCMSLTPTSFSLTLPVDACYTGTLSIANDGAGALAWEVQQTPAAVPWLSVVPASGQVLPDSLLDVSLVLDTHDMAPGRCYTTSLALFHDDPGSSSPLTLPLGLCTPGLRFYFYLPLAVKG